MTKDRTPRDQLPIVEVRRPRCPQCGSTDLQTRRSVKDVIGSTRDTKCRQCGQRFFVVTT